MYKRVLYLAISIIAIIILIVTIFLILFLGGKRISDYRRSNWIVYIPDLELYIKREAPLFKDRAKVFLGKNLNDWELELTLNFPQTTIMPDLYYVKDEGYLFIKSSPKDITACPSSDFLIEYVKHSRRANGESSEVWLLNSSNTEDTLSRLNRFIDAAFRISSGWANESICVYNSSGLPIQFVVLN